MDQEEKPHAPSCDRNQGPILGAITPWLENRKCLLEIGSGTAQHAVFMAPKLPWLTWTLSDVKDRHRGMSLWLREEPILNVKGPLHYEAGATDFPTTAINFDCVYTSNTLHIMTWGRCLDLFKDLKENISSGALLLIYGAFKYKGKFTSDSNKDFEQWLKEKNPDYSIKDFEKIEEELKKNSFKLLDDITMPSNNQLLVFEKK